jgi:putative membrane protein
MTSLANLPAFLGYFVSALVLLAAFIVIYGWLTPLNEWKLVHEGNTAAAVSLIGAALGFALPLATAIIRSANLADMVVWAGVALVLQLACFFVLRLLIRNLADEIASNHMGAATILAGASVTLGVINAACLT